MSRKKYGIIYSYLEYFGFTQLDYERVAFMKKDEQLEERLSDFVAFCNVYGLTKSKRYAGKNMVTLDYDQAMKVFPVKRSALEKFWTGKNTIPDYFVTIMKLHTGQIEPFHSVFSESSIRLTIN